VAGASIKNLFFAILMLVMSSIASAQIEGTVSAYSNYIWRGTTFTENKPAVQADLAYQEKHGFFVGVFVSNAEFSDEAMGSNAAVTSEIDYLIGKQWTGDNWELQVIYNKYTFPGADVFNANDFSFTGNYKNYYFELSYMDEYFGYKSNYQYFRLGYGWNFTPAVDSTLYVGYNVFSNPKGSVKTRCLDAGCTESAETTSGAGNPDYFDVFWVNSKKLENGMVLELAVNWTNRDEYTAEDGEVTKASAKDFAAIAGIVIPFTL
jgi:uncharacterized protein (TIGR02001 family)